MSNFLTVGSQVLILFLLMLIGFACNKAKILNEEANKRISDLVVILVTPCVIIQSFQREFDERLLFQICVALLISLIVHLAMILAVHIIFRSQPDKSRRVLKFASVFSNAGFIALPLQSALLGADGVLMGAAYLVVFNIMLWSYGITLMSGDKTMITPKKLLFSPGIIGVAIGMIVFIFSIKIPQVISSTVGYMAALNVPLPMIVVGYYLAKTNVLEVFRDIQSIKCIFVRLIVFPVVTLALLYMCGIRGTMLCAMVIAMSAPVGATTTMFSEKFERDTQLSVKLISLSTLLSIITMPIIVGVTQTIA